MEFAFVVKINKNWQDFAIAEEKKAFFCSKYLICANEAQS